MLSSLFKRFYNTNNYKNVCFHYETIHSSYNRLKQMINNRTDCQPDKISEVNQIKEELNRIHQHIKNNDTNYTIIYMKLDNCKEKLNYLFRNL